MVSFFEIKNQIKLVFNRNQSYKSWINKWMVSYIKGIFFVGIHSVAKYRNFRFCLHHFYSHFSSHLKTDARYFSNDKNLSIYTLTLQCLDFLSKQHERTLNHKLQHNINVKLTKKEKTNLNVKEKKINIWNVCSNWTWQNHNFTSSLVRKNKNWKTKIKKQNYLV